jgi:hypothetical protein
VDRVEQLGTVSRRCGGRDDAGDGAFLIVEFQPDREQVIVAAFVETFLQVVAGADHPHGFGQGEPGLAARGRDTVGVRRAVLAVALERLAHARVLVQIHRRAAALVAGVPIAGVGGGRVGQIHADHRCHIARVDRPVAGPHHVDRVGLAAVNLALVIQGARRA